MSFDRVGARLEAAIEEARRSGTDPDVLAALNSSCDMFKRRDAFTLKATSEHSKTLAKISHETYTHDWQWEHDQGNIPRVFYPRMTSGRLEGQFLKSLVSMQRAKRILEVGLFMGNGALSMAEALPADGEIVSLETCERLKNLVEEMTKSSHHAKKIRVELGPAIETAKKLVKAGEKFDIIFLDGDKKDYSTLAKMAFDDNLLSEGGTLLVDNAFFLGAAYMPSDDSHLAQGLLDALDSCKAPLHRVMVPMNDGVLMVRRMADVETDTA
ncbi:hypothetical protein EGW08_003448 [Elysia chlorotica]|uniref:Uncharacterized protein n=1 Tax=Elysia chlorotica TaxID=188477 RepID=A0A433U4V1_ELYCH|nr:hypothetical protein EGW08_003448 [Elysia chlorotica]